MSDDAIAHQTKVAWRRVHAGVYLLPGFSRSWEQEVMAACLRGGPGTVASHSTAGALLRLDGCKPAEIRLYARSGWRAEGLHVHRTSALPPCDITSIGPIPSTDASRTLLDLGAVLSADDVEVALESALHRRMTSIARLRWRLDQVGGRGRPGAATLRRLLDLRDPKARPAQSVLEVRFLQRLRRAHLPSPVRQFPVRTMSGRRYVDFAWPEALLGVEVGGRDAHAGPAAEQRDSKRHNELTALGWRLLYFTWDDVDHRIDYVIECILRELNPRLV